MVEQETIGTVAIIYFQIIKNALGKYFKLFTINVTTIQSSKLL